MAQLQREMAALPWTQFFQRPGSCYAAMESRLAAALGRITGAGVEDGGAVAEALSVHSLHTLLGAPTCRGIAADS